MLKRYIGGKAFYQRLFAVMMPILIQNVITNFVSLLDNVMVGQVGTESMSGVAIVNQLFFVFFLSIFGGLAGAGILIAQFYGKGDREGVRQTVRLKIWIAAAAVLVFTAVFSLWGDTLIGLFLHQGQEALDLEATLRHGRDYMAVMLLQMPPFALSQIYASTLRETGETVLPMRAGIVAVFVNLVFNYILIFGKLGAPAMGVGGAAAATVLSRVVECLIVLVGSYRRQESAHWARGLFRSLRVPKELQKKVLLMGLPLLVNELLWAGGMTTLNQCYSLRGLEVISAMNISQTVSNLFFCAFLAMGNATAIMVGQLLGAGELERAVDEDRKLIAFALILCVAVGLLMIPVAPLAPRLYNTTAMVKDLAEKLLLVSAAMMPVHAVCNSCYFTLRSGGKTLITFVFDSGFVWLLNIPTAYLLVHYTALPIVPLTLTVNALDLLKVALGLILVHRRAWVKNLVSE